MKKYKNLFLYVGFILLFVFGIYYLYYFRPIIDDELFNYGFAVSILNGRIPYVDFNMIIPPFFPYLVSLFLLIFGKKLLVYHLLLMLLIMIITFLFFKKISFRVLALYSLMLVYPYIGYNTFCLFLFMLLIYLDDKNFKNKDIVEAIIVSIMFLTKHTLGLLVIPGFIFSKHKKKTLAVYIISILLFFCYLIINHSVFQFLDYAVMGMFEFGSKNSIASVLLFVELFIVLIIFIICIKTRKKEYYYLLCFQIMAFPIANYVHFLISFIPIMYYILCYYKNNFIATIFFTGFSVSFFVIYSVSIYMVRYDIHFFEHYHKDNFMKGRMAYTYMEHSIDILSLQLKEKKYDKLYILGSISYWMKLNLDLPIDKYDLINQGNMGYRGYKGYIKEIKSDCKQKRCLFILSDQEAFGKYENQINLDILMYVRNNYVQEYSSSVYSIYVSKKISVQE